VLVSSFVSFDFVFDCFKCCIIVRYNTFSFVSINLHSQANKQTSKRQKILPEKQKNAETLSESFTSRGKARLQYRVTASAKNLKRQKPIEYKDVAQARDYPKSTKQETNRTASTLPHYIVIPSVQRGGPKLQRFFNKTNNDSDRHMPALLPR
jgi:hypothetical protein